MDREAVAQRIVARVQEGRLPCAEAFALAAELRLPPAEVALAAEALGYRIGRCQLGLFGGPREETPAPAVLPELREQIRAHLEEGKLPCPVAWEIARKLGVERITVGRAADAMGVRISRCMLGCFP